MVKCADVTGYQRERRADMIYFIRNVAWRPGERETCYQDKGFLGADGLMEIGLMGLAGLLAWNLTAT